MYKKRIKYVFFRCHAGTNASGNFESVLAECQDGVAVVNVTVMYMMQDWQFWYPLHQYI